MKTIYFVRHGQCQANADGRVAGSRNDSPLTALGREQAKDTAQALTGKSIDLVVTSPLSRASETAQILAADLSYKGEIRTEPLLTERDFGSATNQPAAEGFDAIDRGEVPDAETLEHLALRMAQVLAVFKALPGQRILVVGSSGAERMLRAVYEGKTHTGFFEVEHLHNGQIREYVID